MPRRSSGKISPSGHLSALSVVVLSSSYPKMRMKDKLQGLQSLVTDFPELTTGLDQLVEEPGSETTGLVGIFTLLQLRLRAVVGLLPHAQSDEESPGSAAR